jgi:hypothetical protein
MPLGVWKLAVEPASFHSLRESTYRKSIAPTRRLEAKRIQRHPALTTNDTWLSNPDSETGWYLTMVQNAMSRYRSTRLPQILVHTQGRSGPGSAQAHQPDSGKGAGHSAHRHKGRSVPCPAPLKLLPAAFRNNHTRTLARAALD